MNKKLIFRILGALSSALIIVSVFVPFISVTGYTTSLWESYASNSIYLPIMIIVFGAIGVIFFALNIKTEFAYMSTGAITFFLVMQTIDILNENTFNTLSIGYYFLIAGAILTGVMAFLTNLKSNAKNDKAVSVEQTTEPSMLDQIDKLYNDQSIPQSEISPIQPVDNVVQPIPVQPLENIVAEQPMPVESINNVEPIQPIEQVGPVSQEQSIPEPVQPAPVEIQPQVQVNAPQQALNPVVQEFDSQPTSNPVVQEFDSQPASNPVVQEFAPQPVQQPMNIPDATNIALSNLDQTKSVNPVVQDFTNPGSTVSPQTDLNTGDVDIFGQPINK